MNGGPIAISLFGKMLKSFNQNGIPMFNYFIKTVKQIDKRGFLFSNTIEMRGLREQKMKPACTLNGTGRLLGIVYYKFI